MDIETYLKKHNLSQKQFADKIGITQGFLSHCITGRKKMPGIRAIQIERTTKGEITIDELINIPT